MKFQWNGIFDKQIDVVLHWKLWLFWLFSQILGTKWRETQDLVPKRDATLHSEMKRQENNERLRRQFAQKANIVGQWIEHQLDIVTNLGLQKGSLEEHQKKLVSVEKEISLYKPNLDELEHYNQEVQESMIFENRHTPYSMEVSSFKSWMDAHNHIGHQCYHGRTAHQQQWYPATIHNSCSLQPWWPLGLRV